MGSSDAATAYSENVFINCPYDPEYKPLFHAILFSVIDCGYVARCALEVADGSQVRFEKITRIIRDSKFGIHDISRTDSDPETGLPRFNMPLELGLFLGANRFGDQKQKSKVCLILDSDKYRYRSFISDIAGFDISAHRNDLGEVINIIRDWLSTASRRKTIPGGREIRRRYGLFLNQLPSMCQELKWDIGALTFIDLTNLMSEWLEQTDY